MNISSCTVRCEDTKVCLGEGGLGSEWKRHQLAASAMRGYIYLQYLCLNDKNRLKYHRKYNGYAAVCRKCVLACSQAHVKL